MPNLREQLTTEAKRLGFEAIGFARADIPLDADFERYEAFVAAEKQGEMTWLAAYPEARRRVDGEHILAGAKTVMCLARRYGRAEEEEDADPELAKRIARYARGRDYHNGLRKKLRKLAAFARTLEEGAQARPLCDREPILERAWAARAGLGFVGKNGLLIVPGVGSLVLLGEVVTTLAIEPDPAIPERCGACTRCLDACPTSAFDAPFVLDPRRCIAYLTIEHRGEVPEPLRSAIGEHLFGCDDCQTVCPFNSARGRKRTVESRHRADPRWETTTLAEVLTLDDSGYARLREGSAVGRATKAGLARNAALVLGNRGEASAIEREALVRATYDVSAVVREAATWALSKIDRRA